MAVGLASTYTIEVNSPCTGSIDVEEVSETQYTGTSTGVFTSAVLLKLSGGGWMIICFTQNQSSACYPTVVFDQDTPDDSPLGMYSQRNGTGTAEVTTT